MNTNTSRFSAALMAQLFAKLGENAATEDSVNAAISSFDVMNALMELDAALYASLAAVMEAVKSNSDLPETEFTEQEVRAVIGGLAIFQASLENPQPEPDRPGPQPPPGPAVTVDLKIARATALCFEFIPPSMYGLQALGEGVPCINGFLAGEYGEAKAIEALQVLLSERNAATTTEFTHLAPEEQAEIRNAVKAILGEVATPRFSKSFLLRLKQLNTLKTPTNEARTALHQEFADDTTRLVLSTGSFKGIMEAIGSLVRGKDAAEAFVLQLRPCELELIKQVFGKPAPVEVPLTPAAVELIANCIEADGNPGDVAELKCFSKAQINGARAVIKVYLHKNEAAVKPAEFYQITETDRTTVLDAIKIRNPKASNPITEAVVRELYVAARRGSGGKDDKGPDRFVSEAIAGINPRHIRAAEMMIRDWQRDGQVRSHVSYGIEPALHRQIIAWFEQIGREEGGMKVLTPPAHPLEAFVRNQHVQAVFDGFKWPVTVVIIVIVVCLLWH